MTGQAAADFVASRRVGDATVTAISDGAGLSTIIKLLMVPEEVWRREVPAEANGDARIGYNVAHVRLGGASILIDLGFDDPSPESQWKAPRHQRSPGVVAGLAAIGVRPEDVTHVLITHAHGDHFAGATTMRDGERVARFPSARHYLGRRDWEGNPNRQQPDSPLARHLGTIERLGLLELVDDQLEIVPGVAMIHAPGESPGHCIVRVQSRDDTFYFLGDLFHHPCEVTHLDWVAQGRDPEQMIASRKKLAAEALASDALLAATHMLFPPFGRLRQTGEGLRWVESET